MKLPAMPKSQMPKNQEGGKPVNLPDAEDPEPEADEFFDPKKVRRPIDFPIYLRVPKESGSVTLEDIDSLPVTARAELKQRLKEMWSISKRRTHLYARCTLKPARYTERDLCIRNIVLRGGSTAAQMYSNGGGFKETADDRCVKSRQPCPHFANYEGKYIIFLVPLPEALRQGKNWTEIDYWVL